MKFTTLFLGLLHTTSTIMAGGGQMAKPTEGGPCSNMAKYGAMKSFRAVTATKFAAKIKSREQTILWASDIARPKPRDRLLHPPI